VPQEPALFSGTGAREHRLRPAPTPPRGDRGRRPRGARRRVHRAAARRATTPGGRARREALRRPAPAARHRARVPQGPGRGGARRGHVEPRLESEELVEQALEELLEGRRRSSSRTA
jgi:hypothetical protein